MAAAMAGFGPGRAHREALSWGAVAAPTVVCRRYRGTQIRERARKAAAGGWGWVPAAGGRGRAIGADAGGRAGAPAPGGGGAPSRGGACARTQTGAAASTSALPPPRRARAARGRAAADDTAAAAAAADALVGEEDAGASPARVANGAAAPAAPAAARTTWITKKELKEITKLALPAFGTLLADPLMSIIDTACIGHVSSLDLAALGPNTAIFNCIFQLFTFLPIATTATVARHTADRDEASAQAALASAMYFAVLSGVAVSATVYAFAPQLLALMGSSPELVSAGLGYLRVRAMAIPVVLLCTVMQGACLGRQDARTPLFIFITAGFINVVADLVAVLPSGLNLGLVGAAFATLIAQTTALLAFLVVLWNRGHMSHRFILPNFDEQIKPFANSSTMLLLGSVCRMGVYTLITMCATTLSTAYVATHQVAMQVFWFLTYFVEPLFVAATSFISRDLAAGKRDKVCRYVRTLVVLSAFVGVLLAAVSGGSRFYASFFTVDPVVVSHLLSISGLMAVAQGVASVTLVVEGVLIGMGELIYLAQVHCLNFVLMCAYLFWGKTTSLGLENIWVGIVLHQTLRLFQHFGHLLRSPILNSNER